MNLIQMEFDFNENKLLKFVDAKKCPHNHSPTFGNNPLHDVWNIYCPDCLSINEELFRGVSQIVDWNHQGESVDKLVRKWNDLVTKCSN